MPERDRIDELAAQWERERPELDAGTMALVARLLRVATLITKEIEDFAAQYGITRAEGDVLFTLRRAGEPFRLSPSRLAASALVASGTMTNRLDRLEQRGLIRRVPNPVDRRGVDVELTEEARVMVDSVIADHVANEERMLEPLDAGDRDQLADLTRRLLAHLEPAAAG